MEPTIELEEEADATFASIDSAVDTVEQDGDTSSQDNEAEMDGVEESMANGSLMVVEETE